MDELGSAATVRIEQHTDRHSARFAVSPHSEYCRTSDGVMTQVDVRARRPLRQIRAVGIGERQSDDTVGGYITTPNLDVDLDFTVGGLSRVVSVVVTTSSALRASGSSMSAERESSCTG